PGALPMILARFGAVVDGQITEARDVPCLRKDGSVLLADVRSSAAIVDCVRCNIAWFTDGSELRRLERNLAEAQRIAHIGSWEFDLTTGTAHRSDELHRILGVEAGAISGESEAFYAFVHPDDRARVQASEQAAIAGRGRHDLDFRIVRPDGNVRIVHEVGDVIRDAQGAAVRITGTVEDVTERVAAEAERNRLAAELERRATYDMLTRVMNRASVMTALEGALARKAGGHTAAIFVDLDHFKEVNDRLGHLAGDELLRIVADRLAITVRARDALGRVGGDEFLVVCPGLAGTDPAIRVAERLAYALNQPVRLAGTTLELQASLGAAYAGRRSVTADALVRRADTAMYASKRDGHGRPVLYSSALARGQRAADKRLYESGEPTGVST
ncbi:MAG: diguanylate cyclase, partial [Candidatus Limnocylindrales bacterium]